MESHLQCARCRAQVKKVMVLRDVRYCSGCIFQAVQKKMAHDAHLAWEREGDPSLEPELSDDDSDDET